jgi:hypothetical protein
LGDYENGVKYLQKSLTEHRTPDVLEKLKVAEKEKVEKERLAYIDPAKAETEREEGNKLFKVSYFTSFESQFRITDVNYPRMIGRLEISLDQSSTTLNRSSETLKILEVTRTVPPLTRNFSPFPKLSKMLTRRSK